MSSHIFSGSPDNYDANYDSDSSLIEAANKSLNLSRSLGAKCMDIDQSESSDEGSDNEKENKVKLIDRHQKV